MATLDKNWLTDGWMDFEYKKYVLLAYLQETAQQFDQKKLYPRLSELEHKMEVCPVGILPLRNEEGYFFLSDFLKKLVSVYYYQVTIFENIQERFRGIHTRFLFDYNVSITDNYEQVKYRLIEQHKHLPNPATYAVEFKESFPLPETMLPIAKRSLVRFISA